MKIRTEANIVNKKFGQAEIQIGRVRFIAGFFLRVFDVGIRLSRYSADVNLGFFTLSLDWYNYSNAHIDWLEELDEEDLLDV